MEKMSVVCEISGANEKCELLLLRCAVLMQNVSVYYMHLLYKMDDINTKVGICLKLFWKSEYFWWEMWEFVIWMNGSDRKSEYIFRDKYWWWKIWAFVFHLVFKMAVPLPAQLSSSSGILWN